MRVYPGWPSGSLWGTCFPSSARRRFFPKLHELQLRKVFLLSCLFCSFVLSLLSLPFFFFPFFLPLFFAFQNLSSLQGHQFNLLPCPAGWAPRMKTLHICSEMLLKVGVLLGEIEMPRKSKRNGPGASQPTGLPLPMAEVPPWQM